MTCTAKSEMSLDEHLLNAEDCVKFDELYFKPLGKKNLGRPKTLSGEHD